MSALESQGKLVYDPAHDRFAEDQEHEGVEGHDHRGLAKEAGISTETIFAIEHGRRQPTVTTLDKIAKALDAEVKDLFS